MHDVDRLRVNGYATTDIVCGLSTTLDGLGVHTLDRVLYSKPNVQW